MSISAVWGAILYIAAVLVSSLIINVVFGHRSYWRRLRWYHLLPDRKGDRAPQGWPRAPPQGEANGSSPQLSPLSACAATRFFADQRGVLPTNVVCGEILPFLKPVDVTVLAQVNRFFRHACSSPSTPYWANAIRRLPPLTRLLGTDEAGAGPPSKPPRQEGQQGEQPLGDRLVEIEGRAAKDPLLEGQAAKEHFFRVVQAMPLAMCRHHTTPHSCRVVIDSKVYDLTPFLSFHPGGDEILLAYSGDRRDTSLMFHTSFHSDAAIELMQRFLLWDPAWLLGREGTLWRATQPPAATAGPPSEKRNGHRGLWPTLIHLPLCVGRRLDSVRRRLYQPVGSRWVWVLCMSLAVAGYYVYLVYRPLWDWGEACACVHWVTPLVAGASAVCAYRLSSRAPALIAAITGT